MSNMFGMKVLLLCSVFNVMLDTLHAQDTNEKKFDPAYLQRLFENGKNEELSQLLQIQVGILNYNQSERDAGIFPELYLSNLKDMILRPWQIDEMEATLHFNGWVKRWNGSVPYAIITTNYTSEELSSIHSKIAEWNALNPIIPFRQRRDDEKDYVVIINGNSCFSNVGFVGDLQVISLSPHCSQKGYYHHGMMHTVGFIHEHMRLDRDEYVDILYDNITPEYKNIMDIVPSDPKKFRSIPGFEFLQILGPFDYYSMMFPNIFYDKNGGKIAEIIRPGIDVSRVGKLSGLSRLDLQKIHDMYT